MKNISDLKYERSWLEIDLNVIRDNIRAVRSKIDDPSRERVKIMAVIKADAYGHGAAAVAGALESEVDFFGVAEIDEAEELRAAGVTRPILILGYTSPADYARLIAQDIRPTIWHLEDAEKFSELACALQRRQHAGAEQSEDAGGDPPAKAIPAGMPGNPEKRVHVDGDFSGQKCNRKKQQNCAEKVEKAKIHIALDTGMTRIGFAPTSESVEQIRRIASMDGMELEGLFTHFSCADMADKSYTERQMEVYDRFVAKLAARGVHIPLCHMENSAGIMEFSHPRYQMVRSGIVTYGLLPSEEVNADALCLRPALTWKSRVVDVKTVGPGLGVSYGATYVTKGGERIATISTGYGDGYPRSLSGKGYVLIRGRRAPILGRVCMDQFMVDVSDIPDVCTEDMVTLIGTDGEETITAERVGELSGRFNYELVCDINKRVPRYYRGLTE